MSPAECLRCSPQATVDTDRGGDSAVSYLFFEQRPQSADGATCDDESKSPGRAQLPLVNSCVGNYQIIRQLGQGGMGAAFEAEQVDNGRRVALKFIAKSASSAESEQRVQQSFLQEGQLAAGINHPHSVYVYSTEVLGGQLVISMELVRGISLQEYMEQQGPLPVKVAIEVILQVIAGLAEANRHGILHRDIKPSNCFIADGVVKVGDYGLAVHFDAGRRIVSPAGFAGTFCYASPEQWKVEPLDVRSDIYGVGGTLHFLLTGQPPFTEWDLAKLRPLVLDVRPPSAQAIRAEIPVDLARIVLRCLEKRPADRFQNYEELQAALRPFGPEVWPAAHPLSRVVAVILDQFPIFAIDFAIAVSIMSYRVDPADFWKEHRVLDLCYALKDVLYYGIPEGLWGMTPGKWLMGIRVVNRDRNPPGIWRACLRATIFAIVPSIPLWIAFVFEPQNEHDIFLRAWLGLASLIIVLLLFSSMRVRNGFAAWHDLLSGTRVQLPPPASGRVTIPVTVSEHKTAESGELGPYAITHALEATQNYEWLLGYDEILQRTVWLRRVPANSSALPAASCCVSRTGRLRWLAGRRTETENWDAFEAVSGQPLVSLLREPQAWQRVRFWLFDLAGELAMARQENNLPSHLGLNRVWITSAGHAKLLDVPAPGSGDAAATSEIPADGFNALCQFLNQVAVSSLNGQVYPAEVAATTAVEQHMPLHALPIVESLRTSDSLDSIGRQLSSILTKPTEVTRRRRAALVLSCLLLPIISAAALLAFSLTLAVWERKMPELKELRDCLVRYEPGPGFPQARVIKDEEDRSHLETYIVGKFKPTITNPQVWHSPYSLLLIPPVQRDAAARLVKTKTEPTEAELAVAEQQILPQLAAQPFKSDVHFVPHAALRLLMVVAVFIAIPALLLTAIFGVGPMQTMLGIGYVTRRGQAARRLRLLWRTGLAWSPVFLSLLLIILSQNSVDLGLSVGISFGVMIALTIVSVLLPQRGIAERLAGVWIVRR